MPWVHRLLYTLRALADDEPPPPSRKKRPSPDRRHRQAVALVLTFRDLFASGGLNVLLEDMESNRYRKSQSFNTSKCASFSSDKLETLKVALESESPLATSDSILHLNADTTVDLLRDERIISSSSSMLASIESPSKLLVPVDPGSGPLEVYGRKRNGTLTVPLNAEDENKTVNALRKALKWSPRKQSLAKFSVPLPREEEHRAVAVVQNAVNRVKEEQQQKSRRKFKFTFC